MGDPLRFDAERLRILIERHHLHTGSARARELLEDWDNARRSFDPNVSYNIEIDRTGDAVPDAVLNIRPSGGGSQYMVSGLGFSLTIPVTPPNQAAVIARDGNVTGFAGQRDDPFFFDLTGFQAFVANPQAPAAGLRPARDARLVGSHARRALA